MARPGTNIVAQTNQLIQDIRGGAFQPVYVLMGEESYYPDLICEEILANAVDESARDFDQFVFYGSDSDADTVITAARGYSMFGGRVLVVLKEAQLMKDLDNLSLYCANPLDSTVLVVYLHGASLDKRKSFYKAAQKAGVIVESPAVRDYEIAQWISDYYSSLGLSISPDAAQLLGESAGTDLAKIASETEKMRKNLPEGENRITVEDIEKNIGVSRQFSIFELTKELSYKNAAKAVKIATYIGSAAKFAMPMAVSALFTHFYRILKYESLLMKSSYPDPGEKAAVLGVNPYFFREYDTAVRNYPLNKTMAVISLLNDYDYKGKGGDVGPDTTPADILIELVIKILNI